MKNILKIILSLIMFACFIKVYAYELTYSEWSSEYPEGVNKKLIESEERYLWYKDTTINIEYLKKEDIKDKEVDYNDFKLTYESKESLIEPEHFVDRTINKKVRNTKYTEDDIYSFTIDNINFKDKVLISEIEVTNNNQKLELIVDDKFSSLINNIYDDYIENKENINIKFKSKQNINNLLVKLYYKCDCKNDNTFNFNYLSDDEYSIYNNTFKVENCIMEIKPTSLNPNLLKSQTFYTYVDKLYKTYNIDRQITKEYYKEYNDQSYTKLESSKKTFYRYITNDIVILDADENIVTNPDEYCKKQYCQLVENKTEVEEPKMPEEPKIPEEIKEVPKKVNNPKTLDNIYYYFILLFLSLLIICLILIINKKKIKKIKLNNKSSFVESI